MGFAAASTFDTVNKGAAVTLSGSNTIATTSAGTGSVRGSNRISGLTYGEYVIGATLTGSARVGVCNSAFVLTGLLGVDNNGVGYDAGGTVKINNATVATIATYTTSSNVGWVVNPFLQLIWFRVNGGNWNNDIIGNQNPVGGVGGISIAAIVGSLSPAWGGSTTSSATEKYASANWTYTAPTGFSSVDTLQASGSNPENHGTQTLGRAPAVSGTQYVGLTLGDCGSGKTIAGVITETGANVAKMVGIYDQASMQLLDMMMSDPSTGAFSLNALGRTQVFAVAFDPTTYQAEVYDQLTPS
jgi:hypothetical protein